MEKVTFTVHSQMFAPAIWTFELKKIEFWFAFITPFQL